MLPAFVIGLEIGIVCWDGPGDGEKLVIPWKLLSKLHESDSEVIFA